MTRPPEDPYWFRFGERWVITSERQVQWTAHAWGRFDLLDTEEEITVPLAVQGLAPWAAEGEDLSSLLVWGSGGNWATLVRTPALAAGIEQMTLDLKDIPADQSGSGLPIALPAYDGTKGDALHLAQVLTGPLRNAEGEAVFAESQHSAVPAWRVLPGRAPPAAQGGRERARPSRSLPGPRAAWRSISAGRASTRWSPPPVPPPRIRRRRPRS